MSTVMDASNPTTNTPVKHKPWIVRLWVLMQREMWENRIGFIWAPLVLSAIVVTISLMSMFMVHQVDTQSLTTMDALRYYDSSFTAEQKSNVMGTSVISMQVIFGSVMLIVTLFYLLGALYDDRKDRSILFWKSLPISDTMTVISKMASGALLLPAVFMIAMAITLFFMLILVSIYAIAADISPWANFWAPAQLFSHFVYFILGTLVQAVWMLPLWGWLLLCSAFAPRLPLLFAVGIPLLISWIHKYWMLVQSFDYRSPSVMYYIGERITQAVLPFNLHAKVGNDTIQIGLGDDEPEGDIINDTLSSVDFSSTMSYLGERLSDLSLWYGVVLGIAFMAAAVYFRRRSSEL